MKKMTPARRRAERQARASVFSLYDHQCCCCLDENLENLVWAHILLRRTHFGAETKYKLYGSVVLCGAHDQIMEALPSYETRIAWLLHFVHAEHKERLQIQMDALLEHLDV